MMRREACFTSGLLSDCLPSALQPVHSEPVASRSLSEWSGYHGALGLGSTSSWTVSHHELDGALGSFSWPPISNIPAKRCPIFEAPPARQVDFPITDVLQMMGRAGRPQFDTEARAVVMVHERPSRRQSAVEGCGYGPVAPCVPGSVCRLCEYIYIYIQKSPEGLYIYIPGLYIYIYVCPACAASGNHDNSTAFFRTNARSRFTHVELVDDVDATPPLFTLP